MSFWEYEQRIKAVKLRDLDDQFNATWTAWLNRSLSQTDEKGYYRIKKLTDVFDYEGLERKILGVKNEDALNKLNELKARSDRAKLAKEKACQIIEERKKRHVNE